jgi:endonuclease G
MFMKKIYVFLFLLPLISLCYGQDTIRISHKNYTTVFSKSKKYPVMVEWWVTKAKVSCVSPIPRKDKFAPDPKLPEHTNLELDYKGSGLDRGHMAPAADNQCQTTKEMEECFYFSNMSPQYHSLNAGDWKTLEVFTREYAKQHDSVHVWAGNIGESKKIGRVSVPKECWKVIFIKKTNEWFAFMFYNTKDKPTGLKSHEVSKEVVEKITGFKFNK